MHIKRVAITNFRSIADCAIDCDQLTVLIGRNGAGKSTFLHALEVFYDVNASITEEDFFNRETASPIEIRLTYANLNDDETAEFKSYVHGGELTVTKKIEMTEAGSVTQSYLSSTPQVPRFAKIRQLGSKSEQRAAFNELVDSGELTGLTERATSADKAHELMGNYEADHEEMTEMIERPAQFFGPRNVGGGKLDNHTKFVLIPAVKDAIDETGSRRGAITQILDTLVMRRLTERDEVMAFRREFTDKARDLFGPETQRDLDRVAASLSDRLEAFAPGSSLKLVWDETTVPEIQPPATRVTLIEDAFEGDIQRKGHGLQRSLVLTLLQELASLPDDLGSPAQQAVDSDRGAVPDLILAIEEPELFLHPSRCRYLARVLVELARAATDNEPGNQVFYTTHSPHFAGLRRFDQVRRLSKNMAHTGAPCTEVASFSLQEAAEALAEAWDKDSSEFTRESFEAHALPVMSQIVSEGFFADAIVLVEGQSELGALWKLQELMEEDWAAAGISVIPVGGKNSLDRPMVIFQGLGIPTYLLFDGDKGCNQQDRARMMTANRICLRLAGATEEDFPTTQVHEHWAVFEDTFEDLLTSELDAATLDAACDTAADELGYDRSKLLKTAQGAARVIELVYKAGARIDTLERIVVAVTKLATS